MPAQAASPVASSGIAAHFAAFPNPDLKPDPWRNLLPRGSRRWNLEHDPVKWNSPASLKFRPSRRHRPAAIGEAMACGPALKSAGAAGQCGTNLRLRTDINRA